LLAEVLKVGLNYALIKMSVLTQQRRSSLGVNHDITS